MKFSRHVNNGLRNRLNSGWPFTFKDQRPRTTVFCRLVLLYICKWQSERSDCSFTWETLYLWNDKNVYLSKPVLWSWNPVVTQLCCGTWGRNLGVSPCHSRGASVCWSAWATGRWRTWQQACDNALRGWTCCQYVFHPPHPTPRVLQWSGTASCWLWRYGSYLDTLGQLHWPRSFQELEDERMTVQKRLNVWPWLPVIHICFGCSARAVIEFYWQRFVVERCSGQDFPSFL